MPHISALDGLRGVAVAGVVLYHFLPSAAPGGFLGVDLFFVLSGFLITSLLVCEWQSTSGIALPAFWARRARRLLPALFLVLAAVGVWALTVPSEPDAHHVAADGLAAFSYVANWHFIASGQSYIEQFLRQAPSPLRHTWSLAIEEQFYLVWPLLLLLIATVVGRRGGRLARQRRVFKRAVIAVALVLGVASVIRMVTLFNHASNPNRVYYGTDTRAFIILIGAALGAATAGVPVVSGRARSLLVVAGCGGAIGIGVAMATATITTPWLYQGGYAALAIVMATVLAAAAQPGRNPLAAVLQWRPLVGLGLISYGVYLWHWPVALWVTARSAGVDGAALFGLRAAITLAASLTSFVLVEQPIRRGRLPRLVVGRMRVATAVVATAVAIPLLVPVVVFPSVAAAPTRAPVAAQAVDVTTAYAAAPRCDGPRGTRIVSKPKMVVQLEGNSVAGEVYHCLEAILASRGVTLETTADDTFLVCRAIPGIREQVSRSHPAAAILFVYAANNPRCGKPWSRPIDELVAIYKAAGTHVFLVPSVPIVPGSPRARELAHGPLDESAYYTGLAAADPAHITVLDAGTFVRDATGAYQWRMPCLPGGEAGCDAQHTVGVRWTDGLHYCTDPNFAADGCVGDEHKAGERRVAAAIAVQLIPVLQQLAARRPTQRR
jgi:peptidoglycan/LPS O-acetylase OafA/YrhL